MSNVSLEIAGRRYTIACAAGEEAHIAMLGGTINAKLAAMPDLSGQSEQRTLLFAALLLADELHESKGAGNAASKGANRAEPLENLATRLETLASRLESSAPNA